MQLESQLSGGRVRVDELQRRRKAGDALADEYRDAGKPGNFGKAGGMSKWQTLQSYARKSYGVSLTDEMAQRVCAAWDTVAATDERKQWLSYIDTLKTPLGRYDIDLPFTSIVRRNVSVV